MVRKVGKYEIGKTLGEGTFGKVKYATNVETGQRVAIKILDKDKIQKQNMGAQIKKEISIMKMVKERHIVELYEVLASRSKIFIVLELVTGGELFDKIVSEGRFNEDTARKYFRQLIGGMHYCHAQGVCHRDLKPENLLLDEEGLLKISDFGLSALFTGAGDDDGRATLLHTTCGTPNYVAPEVLSDKGYDGRAADVWSCGVILYVLLAGFLPFDEPHMSALFRKIQKAEFSYPSWITPEARALMDKILVVDPAKRLTVEQVASDPWYTKGMNAAESAAAAAAVAAGANLVHTPSKHDLDSAVQDAPADADAAAAAAETESVPQANVFQAVNVLGGMALNKMLATSSGSDAATMRGKHFFSPLAMAELIERASSVLKGEGCTIETSGYQVVGSMHTNAGGATVEGAMPLPALGEVKIVVEAQVVGEGVHVCEVRKLKGDSLAFHKLFCKVQPKLKHALES